MTFMRWLFVCGTVLLLGMRGAVGFEAGHILVGEVRIIDGDTLEIAGSRIRLNGLAAPERDEQGGPEATDFMKRLTADAVVRCSLTGEKTHEREVGTCWIGTVDVAAALIAAGLARDCPRFSGGRYFALEPDAARKLPFPHYCQPR